LLNSTLDGYFPRLSLGLRQPNIALRGPLVVVGHSKVVTLIGHLINIGQELLLIAKVGLEHIGLLL
jgi:hypothetical protein